jgi:hypothetical protein
MMPSARAQADGGGLSCVSFAGPPGFYPADFQPVSMVLAVRVSSDWVTRCAEHVARTPGLTTNPFLHLRPSRAMLDPPPAKH